MLPTVGLCFRLGEDAAGRAKGGRMQDKGTGPGRTEGLGAGRGFGKGDGADLLSWRLARSTLWRELGDRTTRRGMLIVLAVYLVLGALYATRTPAWQVPDEPAHYNYVKYVAENGQLPKLEVGDYPADYLEQIKSQRFPPSLSIEAIRYESHQPPLYYLSAAAVYRLGRMLLGHAGTDREAAVLLRLFSVLIGGVTLVVGYLIVRKVYTGEPMLAVGTVAFMAFLPMHLAMNAGVNNDALSELMLALVVWRLVAMDSRLWSWRGTLGVGLLLGLALLTKMQAYVAAGVILFALAWDVLAARWSGGPRGSRIGFTWSQALARAGIVFGVALVVVSPWLVRNMRVYGLHDPLAMVRHDQVVMGQLTTRQFIDQYGAARLVRDLVVTTFHSFWGQFGWMGVLLHERLYTVLLVVSGLAGVGLLRYVWSLREGMGGAGKSGEGTRRYASATAAMLGGSEQALDGEGGGRKKKKDASVTGGLVDGLGGVAGGGSAGGRATRDAAAGCQRQMAGAVTMSGKAALNGRGMALLLVWALGTTLVFLWYNTKYVQHQGRYLFPALVPWGLAFALGLRTLLRRSPMPILVALGGLLVLLVAHGALQGDIKEFYVALTVAAGGVIAAGHWLESRRPGAAIALAYVALCALALICLYAYVVPNLQPLA